MPSKAEVKRGWFYLSFATQTRFLNAAIVQALDLETAIQRCRDLRIYPGGEVLCQPISDANMRRRVPPSFRDRKLTALDVDELSRAKPRPRKPITPTAR